MLMLAMLIANMKIILRNLFIFPSESPVIPTKACCRHSSLWSAVRQLTDCRFRPASSLAPHQSMHGQQTGPLQRGSTLSHYERATNTHPIPLPNLGPPPRQAFDGFPFPLVHLRIDHSDLEENSLGFNAAAEIFEFRR